jgi:hypothetical protein
MRRRPLRVGRAFPLGHTVGAAMAVDRTSCMRPTTVQVRQANVGLWWRPSLTKESLKYVSARLGRRVANAAASKAAF